MKYLFLISSIININTFSLFFIIIFVVAIKKEERIKFCQKILDLKLQEKDLYFIDECIIDCNHFVNEKIRLSKENPEKLKKGETETLNL